MTLAQTNAATDQRGLQLNDARMLDPSRDLVTGNEYRAAAKAMRDCGLSYPQIAERLGCETANAARYAREPRRADRVVTAKLPLDWGVCQACGASIRYTGSTAHNKGRGIRCASCVRTTMGAKLNERRDKLAAFARQLGRVPTVSEAAACLELGRSSAGAIVCQVFGPDERLGSKGAAWTPRPLPDWVTQ